MAGSVMKTSDELLDELNRHYFEAWTDEGEDATMLVNVTDEGIILDLFVEDGTVVKTAALDLDRMLSLMTDCRIDY